MKTAIVILNYNSEDCTIEYVNKIKEYKILDKIIIVDNNSTNIDSVKKLKELENENIIVLTSDENLGYSYGNNIGLKYLDSLNEKFDFVVISNPDVDVSKFAFEKCFEELENNKDYAIVSPKMLNKDGNRIRRCAWKIRNPKLDMVNTTRLNEIFFNKIFKSGEYDENLFNQEKLEVEAITGAFFVIKFDILKKVNFFDENVFLFYEEDILATKIKKLNMKIISLNTINFIHFESQTIGKVFNAFKKLQILQKSKMYFQKEYNHINILQNIIFRILIIWRYIELLVEIPIRKVLKK